MIRVKTFDSTGIATGGRLYASDLNSIQDAAAGLTDFTQNISAGSVIFGEVGLAISKFGTGEAQVTGSFRSTGRFLGAGGIIPGSFTTTTRNAIAAGGAPTGIIIYNSTTAQFEWNSGSDGARVWKSLGVDTGGSLAFTGGASGIAFTDQTAGNFPFKAKRTADSVDRIAIKEDGTIEMGAGGASARDVNLYRSAADDLKTDDGFVVAHQKGLALPGAYGTALPSSPRDGQIFTLTDSITLPTWEWELRYNAAAAKWYYHGGSPATVLVAATVNSAAGNNVWSAALTPTFTFPISGDYDIRATWNAENNPAFASSDQGFGVNGVPGTDEYTGAGGSASQMYLFIRKTGITAAQTGSFYIRDTDTTRRNGMSRRRFEIVPFRLG